MTEKLCVIGLGYIGLPTACLFATHGYEVLGVDTQQGVVDAVGRGSTPFDEPGLEGLLREALDSNRLQVSTRLEVADVLIIAVPTPLDGRTRMADLSNVRQAANSIASFLRKGNMVVLESTVPPGTSQKLLATTLEESGLRAGQDFDLVHCPERAIPGNAVHEMVHNDRIIGGISGQSAERARKLYSCFVQASFHQTNLWTAEMVKLMENTYRDLNIALANEFAQIAEENEVNVWEAIELANMHPRVDILKPGPGVGGHCLAIDPWFLAGDSAQSKIIALAREINDSMAGHVLKLVRGLVGERRQARIAVLGVAYKGNVGDTRESPALRFIRLAENEGLQVRVCDPLVSQFEYELHPLEEAVRNSDCLVVLTDHSRFREIDPTAVAELMRARNLVDSRNLLDHERWRAAGFRTKVLGDGTLP